MIYHDTPRPLWRFSVTGTKFFGSTLLFLFGTLLMFQDSIIAYIGLTSVSIILLMQDKNLLSHRNSDKVSDEYLSARIWTEAAPLVSKLRFILTGLGGVIIPIAMLITKHHSMTIAGTALALSVAGQLFERYLFFRASVGRKMPGGIVS